MMDQPAEQMDQLPPMEPGKATPPFDFKANLKPCKKNKFSCIHPKINATDFPVLKDYLPEKFDYHVCGYETINKTGDHVNFRASFRMPLTTEEEIKQWLKAHTVTWRVDRTCPRKGHKVLYKVAFRCQHKTRPRGAVPMSKNTNCPAKMSVTLIRAEGSHGRKSQSKDPHMPEFPTIVSLSSDHNHNIYVAAALKHRNVGEDTKQKLEKLFEAGHSPSSALDVLKYDLQVEHGENYLFASADGALCPTLMYCYRLYHQIFRKEYGSAKEEKMREALEEKCKRYNEDCREECARVSTSSNQLLVAICSPLMKRVHANLKHSGEMCFMDASGNMDRQHCRVFLLLTHSCAGGLPLGIIITQSEAEQVIFEGLELLKSLLGEDAFCGRGQSGPMVFLTDDSQAERAAIHRAFPQAKLLLCSFHLLQAVWRWLWCKEHSITQSDRGTLFAVVRGMMYAREEATLDSLYSQALGSAAFERYPQFKTYIQKLYSRKECWALCFRDAMLVRNNNTNNFSEAAMRILKDKILNRTKAYNIPQLVDFLTTRLSVFHSYLLTTATSILKT